MKSHSEMLERLDVADDILQNELFDLPESLSKFLSALIGDLGAHYRKSMRAYEEYDKLV